MAESVSEEKQALEELHAAMAKAMHEADARGELASFVRDRFLQNGLIPAPAMNEADGRGTGMSGGGTPSRVHSPGRVRIALSGRLLWVESPWHAAC